MDGEPTEVSLVPRPKRGSGPGEIQGMGLDLSFSSKPRDTHQDVLSKRERKLL